MFTVLETGNSTVRLPAKPAATESLFLIDGLFFVHSHDRNGLPDLFHKDTSLLRRALQSRLSNPVQAPPLNIIVLVTVYQYNNSEVTFRQAVRQ